MQWRLKAFLNQLKSIDLSLNKSLIGLEIGCGHGVVRNQVEGCSNWIVEGVELDHQALLRNPKGRGNIYLYDINEKNNDFKEKYDFIILFDVLEHISETPQFLESCLFHLKKDGYLFINVPALQTLYSAYDIAAGHVRRYNTKTLAEELSPFNITLLDIRYWGLSLISFLMLRKLILRKDQDHDQIIRTGFKPPHPFVNSCFKGLMNMETAFIKKPFLGTSVMAAYKK